MSVQVVHLRVAVGSSEFLSFHFIIAPSSCGVISLSNAVATLPVAQAGVGTFVVFECKGESLSVDELFPALFNARSRFHEESTTLGVTDLCCTVALSEVIDNAFNDGIRRQCEGRDKVIEEYRYAEDKEDGDEDRSRAGSG